MFYLGTKVNPTPEIRSVRYDRRANWRVPHDYVFGSHIVSFLCNVCITRDIQLS